jgi:Holliday junction resolvase RusA-like endonuclease
VVKGHAFYSKRVKAYRDELTWTFRSFRDKRCPFRGLVRVEIDVAGANLSADGDNIVKAVLDSLVDASVLASDSLRVVAEIEVRRVEPGCGVWVRVRPLQRVAPRTE